MRDFDWIGGYPHICFGGRSSARPCSVVIIRICSDQHVFLDEAKERDERAMYTAVSCVPASKPNVGGQLLARQAYLQVDRQASSSRPFCFCLVFLFWVLPRWVSLHSTALCRERRSVQAFFFALAIFSRVRGGENHIST